MARYGPIMFKRAKSAITTLFKTYGTTAVVVWLTTWVVGFAGFYVSAACALSTSGVESTCWQTGAAAYGAFVLSYPLRVGATVALTPPIALKLQRLRE